MALLFLVVTFFTLMIIGLPIAFNLILSAAVYLTVGGYPLMLIVQRMYEGMNSFALLAVPFFVLTGQFMLKGNLLEDLIDFVNAFFGHVRGAIALVTVGTCLLMGSIVGLAVAEAASLGSFLIPMMKKEKYGAPFASGVMATASLLGPIMPPSVLMILYCIAVGRTSTAGLFMAAVIPAIMITSAQMIVVYFISKKRNYPCYPKKDWPEKWKQVKKAIPVLILPVIILGGIFGGIFTITEASAVAALYSAILAFFVTKGAKFKDIPEIFLETAATSGLVIILAGSATAVAWAIANEQIINSLVAPLSSIPVWAFLLAVNILLLINGCFMDDYASVVVLAPIIAPIAWQLGVHPLHIALIICVNLVVGLATPPFGIALFVTSPIAGVKIEDTVREALPMIIATIAILLLITFVPAVPMFLPKLLGYY